MADPLPMPTMPTSSEDTATAPRRPDRLRANAWHRKAGRPVQLWLMGIILVGLFHWAIPEYRWLLIHMLTLGGITNSIMLWSQHLTEKFLHQRLDDATRPWQVRRFWILNAGIIITMIGQVSPWWPLSIVGATIVGASLLFHAYYLLSQYRRVQSTQEQPIPDAKKRYHGSVIAYIVSACCLPIGAVFGGIMAADVPSPLKDQLLLAHLVTNILGFVGIAAMASLMVLFPTIWRTHAGREHIRLSLLVLCLGLVLAAGGALCNLPILVGVGLLCYAVGWLIAGRSWWFAVRTVAQDPRDRITFAAASVAMAPLWLLYGVISCAVSAFRSEQVVDITLPTLPLLIGFAAQLLLGVLSFLLPSNIGGGPNAMRTGLAKLNAAGLFRSTLLNVGLALWMLAEASWLRVTLSILALGALAVFVPLMPVAVRAQLGVIRGKREPVEPAKRPAWHQVGLALSILALVVACFGGLRPVAQAPTTGAGPVSEVTVHVRGMHFEPSSVTVPAGNSLSITLVNEDEHAHDLRLANGANSGRILPGKSVTFEAGTITEPLEGWCTIAGHRQQGMVFNVLVDGTPGAP